MELLSFPAITFPEKQAIESLLVRMVYLAITSAIEDETIEFRRIHKTKLPDSIIAATARHARIELLTLDQKLAGKLWVRRNYGSRIRGEWTVKSLMK